MSIPASKPRKNMELIAMLSPATCADVSRDYNIEHNMYADFVFCNIIEVFLCLHISCIQFAASAMKMPISMQLDPYLVRTKKTNINVTGLHLLP